MKSESNMKPNICPKVGSSGTAAPVAGIGAADSTPMMSSRDAPR
jgi:hypothetical protein